MGTQLRLLCSSAYLISILGLVSCSQDSVQTADDQFKIRPPQFVVNGKQWEWSELTAHGVRMELTSEIDFGEQLKGASLIVKSRCRIDDSPAALGSVRWRSPERLALFQLLPVATLADFNFLDRDRSCDLEFVAENSDGSRHYFNLVSQKIGGFRQALGWEILKNGHQNLEAYQAIKSDEHSRYWNAPIQEARSFKLDCEGFSVGPTSIPRSRFSIAELNWPTEIPLKAEYLCRFFGFSTAGLIAISSPIKLRFGRLQLSPKMEKKNWFRLPSQKGSLMAKMTVKNPYPSVVRLIGYHRNFRASPELVQAAPMSGTLSVLTAPEVIVQVSPNMSRHAERIKSIGSLWSVELSPQEELELNLVLLQSLSCPPPKGSMMIPGVPPPTGLGVNLQFTESETPRISAVLIRNDRSESVLGDILLFGSNQYWYSASPNYHWPEIAQKAVRSPHFSCVAN